MLCCYHCGTISGAVLQKMFTVVALLLPATAAEASSSDDYSSRLTLGDHDWDYAPVVTP